MCKFQGGVNLSSLRSEAGEAGAVEGRDSGGQVVHGDGLAELAVQGHDSGPGGTRDVAFVLDGRAFADFGGDFFQEERQDHGAL